MKVCLISYFYLETTFPLAKHLAEINNCDVSVICLFPLINRKGNVVDFSNYNVCNGFDNRYFSQAFNSKLQQYLSNVKIDTFFITAFRKSPIKFISNLFKLSISIKRQNYDIVHFIGESLSILILRILFLRKKTIHTLHEVTEHEVNGRKSLSRYLLLKFLTYNKCKIIFHSSISKERFIQFSGMSIFRSYNITERLYIIPFGLFETFNCFSADEFVEEDGNSVLFFGRITTYKGLKYLLGSLDYLKAKIPSIKIIIAGEGKIELDLINNSNIEIINRQLSNEEITFYIKKSKIILCPYLSASQSGIPMVSFLFGKPVIATNVGGFPEMIEHMKTGLIIPVADSKAISDAIELLLTNKELLNSMSKNIFIKYNHNNQSWNNLALETYKLYATI